MSDLAEAREILDTILGYLGFVVEIEEMETSGGPCLQVFTGEADALIGPEGERLDDIQYLLNRLLHKRHEEAGRVRVDVEHFRSMQEDELVQEARQLAEGVKATGRPAKLKPLNSYFRRVIHNAFLEDPDIVTWSPKDSARMKRVVIKRREG
ncbi:MAG: R3H domain-containing nucleic acid-binding protein [Verrucomicrobiota bacterium]